MTDQAIKSPVLVSYKGFDDNWKCHGYQFKVGETFTNDGSVKLFGSGFHACKYPLGVFFYYPPTNSRFAVVEQFGEISRCHDDSKIASKSLTVKAEIGIPGLIKAAIEYTTSRCTPIGPDYPASSTDDRGAALTTGYQSAASSTGYQSAASSTGHQSAASSTGDQSAASSTGDRGAASSTGHQSAALTTGDQSAASSTGYQSAASSTGHQSAASSTGDHSAASSTGYQSAASSTGYHSAASSTGDQSAASSTGYHSAASSTGDHSAALSTGDRGAASSTGKASVAMAVGYQARVMAAETCGITLAYRDDEGNLLHLRSSLVGQNGIKAGVWYSLNADGEFIEVSIESN